MQSRVMPRNKNNRHNISNILFDDRYRFCGQQKLDDKIGCGAHRANYTKLDGLHVKGVMFDPIEAVEVAEAEADDEEQEAPKRRKSSTRAKKIKF